MIVIIADKLAFFPQQITFQITSYYYIDIVAILAAEPNRRFAWQLIPIG